MEEYKFNPQIIRKYDIRGSFNDTLTLKDAYFLGLAFANYLTTRLKKVVVCCDTRHHGKDLKNSFCLGLLDAGVNVTDIGVGPSPMLYYACKTMDFDAGVMVTGSHNPAKDNGFKFILKNGLIDEEEIIKISQSPMQKATYKGKISTHDIQAAYVDRIWSDLKNKNHFRIGFECLNGAAGAIVKNLAGRLNCADFVLNADMSGDFSKFAPDPTIESSLVNLKNLIQTKNLDFGIAFDGDADRIVVVTGDLRILHGDDIMTLLVTDVLRNNVGGKVIFDVKCGFTLRDQILKYSGQPIMYKTGHSLIKQKMVQENAVFAGEMSGHIYFADKYYGFDDAIYTAIRLINLLLYEEKSLKTLVSEMPRVYKSPEIKIQKANKFEFISKLSEYLKEQKIKFINIDGVRIEYPNKSWLLIRASNTEEVLIVKYEAQTAQDFQQIKTYTEGLIRLIS